MKPIYKDFMNQFEAARKEIESLPAFMKESLRHATLTLPPTKAEPPPKPRPSRKKA